MRLQDYWGVGPKTSERLRESLGVERAVEAIEGADIRTLAEAGVPRGRAVRILRRANGAAGMDALGTRDVHDVYDDLLTLASEYAVTDHAADRIRVLTPLERAEDREARLDDVADALDIAKPRATRPTGTTKTAPRFGRVCDWRSTGASDRRRANGCVKRSASRPRSCPSSRPTCER